MAKNPAVSAEQYGLAQAVLSGAVRGPSMPKEVAREIIARTPQKERVKFAEQLAAKRKNPASGDYWVEAPELERQYFDDPSEAIVFAQTIADIEGETVIVYGPNGDRAMIEPQSNPTEQFATGDYDADREAAKRFVRLLEAEGIEAEMFRDWSGGFTVVTKANPRKHHSAAWHRCLADVRKSGTAASPAAVCTASVGNPRHVVNAGPSEKQLNYIASLMGVRDNKWHSSAYAEIERITGTKEKHATSQDASRTIAALLSKKGNPRQFAMISGAGRRKRSNCGSHEATITQGAARAEVYQEGPQDFSSILFIDGHKQDASGTVSDLGSAVEWAREAVAAAANPVDYVETALSTAAPYALGPAGSIIAADQSLGKQSITGKALSKGKAALSRLHQHVRKALHRNPEEAAAQMFEVFHGTPSREVIEITEQQHIHEWVAEVGTLIELIIVNEKGTKELVLKAPEPSEAKIEDVVRLTVNEDGDQLFFTGGDQSIDLDMLLEKFGFREDDIREQMMIGRIRQITYRTKKSFESQGQEEIDFFHEHGKEGTAGVLPYLTYQPLNPSMSVFGGRYKVSPPAGFLNHVSPGIVG